MTRKQFFESIEDLEELTDWLEYFGRRPSAEAILAQQAEILCKANGVKNVKASDFYPPLKDAPPQSEQSSIEAAKTWGLLLEENKKRAADAKSALERACAIAAKGQRAAPAASNPPAALRGPDLKGERTPPTPK